MAGGESALVQQIRQGCRVLGVPCFRLNSGAFVLSAPGRKRRYFQASFAGCPDLMMFSPGRVIWVECKSDKGKLSPHQLEYKRLCDEYKIPYVIARRWEDVEAWLK